MTERRGLRGQRASDGPGRPVPAPGSDHFTEEPRAQTLIADVVGLNAEHRREDPGVEGNARLTGTAGLLLLVMFAAEGLTIASIHGLLSWHIAIGLALVPPALVKLGSTLWRFGHYYLGDPRYRQAGPPHPLLRVVGPFVALTTIAVLATGIATWLAGPGFNTLFTLHQASFFVWFAAMAVHVLAHTLRAGRLTRADLRAPGGHHQTVPNRRGRQGLVLLSLAAGVALGVATAGVATGWAHVVGHHLH